MFDARPEISRRVAAVLDAFKKETEYPRIVALEYGDSEGVIPLQAADLIAWEFNRNGRKILDEGMDAITTKELFDLAKRMYYLHAQIARRDKIIEMKQFAQTHHRSEIIAQLGDHFKNFGHSSSAADGRKRRKKQKKQS